MAGFGSGDCFETDRPFTGRTRALIPREEISGSVLSVIPFADEEEAAEIANGAPHGLAAGVWTRNMRRPGAGERAGRDPRISVAKQCLDQHRDRGS
jgi:hypothetical protein